MLIHLSLFVLFQLPELSTNTCQSHSLSVGTPQSVCVVCFSGVETPGTCVGTPQSVCVVSGS